MTRRSLGLKNCVEADLCVCIASTATKNNFEEFPAIIDLAEEVGAERFTYFNFIPTGRGKAHYDQDLSPEEREKLMRYLLARMSKGCKTTILTTAPQLARVGLQCQGPEGTGEVTMSMAHMQTVKVTKKAVPLGRFYRWMRRRKIILFTVASRGCSPMRLLARKRGQPEN